MVPNPKQHTAKPLRGDSRPVHSSQTGVHERLPDVVRRHAVEPWRAPLHRPTVAAFGRVEEWRKARGAQHPIVLDTGCGTGESTVRLAERHPDALVLGIDQSAARLRRVGAEDGFHDEGKLAWVRAELASFWRLVLDAGWPVSHQYLLYPNPWPKPGQLQRRWHGHPVFPTLLAVGGALELRSNWQIYVDEFAVALDVMGQGAVSRDAIPHGDADLTPFERKYAASGHDLWGLRCTLTKKAK